MLDVGAHTRRFIHDLQYLQPTRGNASQSVGSRFKSAMIAATKSAAGCCHRGDSSGMIPVVVEFGSDGHVQRVKARTTFANPMTNQCIVSKLSELSVPTTLPTPIVVTADFRLRGTPLRGGQCRGFRDEHR